MTTKTSPRRHRRFRRRVVVNVVAAPRVWHRRVHPSSIGHMVLAKAFLNVLGFEWK